MDTPQGLFRTPAVIPETETREAIDHADFGGYPGGSDRTEPNTTRDGPVDTNPENKTTETGGIDRQKLTEVTTEEEGEQPDHAPPKLEINFLECNGQPIRRMKVQIAWDGGELLTATDDKGRLPPLQAPPGAELSFAVQRFNGTYKAIGECFMPASDGILTGISPNSVYELLTERHSGDSGDAERKIPQTSSTDKGDLAPEEGVGRTPAASTSPIGAPANPNSASTATNRQKPKPRANQKPAPITKQTASLPPQNISGKIASKPTLEKGRDINGNPFSVVTQKVLDWWNSWRMPTFNLWGGGGNAETSQEKTAAPTTPVTLNSNMQARVSNLLEFAKEQTKYKYTRGTVNTLTEMASGTFSHQPNEKLSTDSLGQCYVYVKIALSRCKIIDEILAIKRLPNQGDAEHFAMQNSASKAGPALLAQGFTEVTKFIPDARWAAAGDIIVYEWTEETWNKRKKNEEQKINKETPNYPNHGHIDVRDYETYISDHMPKALHPSWSNYRNIRIYRKDYDLLPTIRITAFLSCLREFECQEEVDDTKRYKKLHSALPNTTNRDFSDFSTHPWATLSETERKMALKDPGKSTSAGAYQIKHRTWKEIFDKKLIEIRPGAACFTPSIQDAIAVIKLEDRDALHLIRTGRIVEAINQTTIRNEWPSLPGGSENANRHTGKNKPMDMEYLQSLFEKHLSEEKKKAGL